jgi:hypothetical protein
MRAEVEPNLTAFLSIPLENLAIPFKSDLGFLEKRTAARQCPGPPLAIAAVAHVHYHGVAGCVRAK